MSLLRKILNRIGSSKYDNCPNCGDNWWWKKSGQLYYSESSYVLICKECLTDPWNLDAEKIVRELCYMKPYGYSRKETLKKIKKAVITYKRATCEDY